MSSALSLSYKILLADRPAKKNALGPRGLASGTGGRPSQRWPPPVRSPFDPALAGTKLERLRELPSANPSDFLCNLFKKNIEKSKISGHRCLRFCPPAPSALIFSGVLGIEPGGTFGDGADQLNKSALWPKIRVRHKGCQKRAGQKDRSSRLTFKRSSGIFFYGCPAPEA